MLDVQIPAIEMLFAHAALVRETTLALATVAKHVLPEAESPPTAAANMLLVLLLAINLFCCWLRGYVRVISEKLIGCWDLLVKQGVEQSEGRLGCTNINQNDLKACLKCT